MQSNSRNFLTPYQWELIYKSLELSRQVFLKNPVLIDVMEEEERKYFFDDLSEIMAKIGIDGSEAVKES
jgi:hypothetical protein